MHFYEWLSLFALMVYLLTQSHVLSGKSFFKRFFSIFSQDLYLVSPSTFDTHIQLNQNFFFFQFENGKIPFRWNLKEISYWKARLSTIFVRHFLFLENWIFSNFHANYYLHSRINNSMWKLRAHSKQTFQFGNKRKRDSNASNRHESQLERRAVVQCCCVLNAMLSNMSAQLNCQNQKYTHQMHWKHEVLQVYRWSICCFMIKFPFIFVLISYFRNIQQISNDKCLSRCSVLRRLK